MSSLIQSPLGRYGISFIIIGLTTSYGCGKTGSTSIRSAAVQSQEEDGSSEANGPDDDSAFKIELHSKRIATALEASKAETATNKKKKPASCPSTTSIPALPVVKPGSATGMTVKETQTFMLFACSKTLEQFSTLGEYAATVDQKGIEAAKILDANYGEQLLRMQNIVKLSSLGNLKSLHIFFCNSSPANTPVPTPPTTGKVESSPKVEAPIPVGKAP
jgi:hypothetical protein